MEEGFDYDGHRAWFARELRHEPNPRRLFQDAFNDVPVEAIEGRGAAHDTIFLSAREPAEFPDGTYPVDVTRTSERLLRSFERPRTTSDSDRSSSSISAQAREAAK